MCAIGFHTRFILIRSGAYSSGFKLQRKCLRAACSLSPLATHYKNDVTIGAIMNTQQDSGLWA